MNLDPITHTANAPAGAKIKMLVMSSETIVIMSKRTKGTTRHNPFMCWFPQKFEP